MFEFNKEDVIILRFLQYIFLQFLVLISNLQHFHALVYIKIHRIRIIYISLIFDTQSHYYVCSNSVSKSYLLIVFVKIWIYLNSSNYGTPIQRSDKYHSATRLTRFVYWIYITDRDVAAIISISRCQINLTRIKTTNYGQIRAYVRKYQFEPRKQLNDNAPPSCLLRNDINFEQIKQDLITSARVHWNNFDTR